MSNQEGKQSDIAASTKRKSLWRRLSQGGQPEELVGVGIVVIGFTQEQAADQTLDSMKQANETRRILF